MIHRAACITSQLEWTRGIRDRLENKIFSLRPFEHRGVGSVCVWGGGVGFPNSWYFCEY